VLRIFIALKNPPPWQGFEPEIFGPSGQHTNYYTTKATYFETKGPISQNAVTVTLVAVRTGNRELLL
jgi:hypothetical protein